MIGKKLARAGALQGVRPGRAAELLADALLTAQQDRN
jgi:hypothetical protein